MKAGQDGEASNAIAGLILAGGRARRMGGEDKGLIPLAGRPMVEHVLERIGPQVDEVLINANRNAEQYGRYGHRVIPDVVDDFPGPVAHDGERLQPVVALLRCSLLPQLRAFVEQGGRKIDTWYAQHRMVATDLSDHPEAFVNVNTPEERAALEQRVMANAPT